MRTRRAWLAATASLAGVAALPRGVIGRPQTGLRPIAFGKLPPDFNFATPSGPASLRSLRGRPVVINFWATFCEPCIGELDTFARLASVYGDGVALLTISDEPLDTTTPILRAHAVAGHNICDFERTIFDRYGVTPIPTTLVLAVDGSVTHVSIGQLDWPELEAAVTAAGAKSVSAAG